MRTKTAHVSERAEEWQEVWIMKLEGNWGISAFCVRRWPHGVAEFWAHSFRKSQVCKYLIWTRKFKVPQTEIKWSCLFRSTHKSFFFFPTTYKQQLAEPLCISYFYRNLCLLLILKFKSLDTNKTFMWGLENWPHLHRSGEKLQAHT